ncbi:MAG: SDR family oxidoreductase [Lachnospiraceae bacterium]
MYPVYPYESYEEQCLKVPVAFPAQKQNEQPGLESIMTPPPIFDHPEYQASGRLNQKTAIITGGDSGIGRAAAVAFAREGANVAINFAEREEKDADAVKEYIEALGGSCHLIEGDIRDPDTCKRLADETADRYGSINILVNNCGVQFVQDSIMDISIEQMIHTFEVNVFSFFVLTKAVYPYLRKGDSIINTTSVVAYEGNKQLIDYSATKGAIVSFTRSLALSLADSGIRVNAVAPGSFWTPLQPASWDAGQIRTFGTDNPMGRAGQPFEIAPTYVYLASDDSRYMTGQVIHVNGGQFVGT